MIKKILIANRGEIACRVIRTARRLGIATVAVYSEADRNALHVEQADEAVFIGPAPAAESYLVIDTILKAIADTGADAVHPGYGFLSERAEFAEALAKQGVAFIGPNPNAIRAMGDKIESKKLAKEAGVNTVPGYLGVIEDDGEAVKIARDIGYPVMIKASAGGGGKGMRVAYNDTEVREGFKSARNEARSSFADDRVFIEKFIEEPRHIEIQVLGDGHGNAIHLGERECSIQRRHQKVIEEAPSPFLDAETRAAMGAQAVALAQAVDYNSAGTVEFIVDADRNFYFLEMNTRLQVEHPVTELVTGLDLVEQMIRVAAGEKLALSQDEIELKGWAMEARVYAEDPYRGFLPSTGRLVRYRAPEENDHVRVDTGVFEGGEISIYYDPMIAKLCTKGTTRAEAIARLREALDEYRITGISHNIPFLAAVAAHPRFREGRLSTNFIAEEYPDGFLGAQLDGDERAALMASAVLIHRLSVARQGAISGQLNAVNGYHGESWVVNYDGEDHEAAVGEGVDGCDVSFGGKTYAVRSDWFPGEVLFTGQVNNRPVAIQIAHLNDGYRLTHGGAAVDVAVRTPRAAKLAALMPHKEPPDLSKFLLCPMPGLVVSIDVTEGEEVKAGQTLAVVEAMKMENVLRAEWDGTVKEVRAKAGDSLAVDDVILEFA
jgi:propionyl-CoA carboxylase alpha chain